MGQRVTLRRDDLIDFHFRFYVDLKPTTLLMRRGSSNRWEVVAEMPDGNKAMIFSGHAKRKLILSVRVIINAGLTAYLKDSEHGKKRAS